MRYKIAVVFATLTLSACVDAGTAVFDLAGIGLLNRAPSSVVVAEKSVKIVGPAGYCVDRSATRDSKNGVFVLLASCASIANNVRAAKPRAPAMLTASVSGMNDAEIQGSVGRLVQYFKTESGRAALARDGRAGSVRISETHQSNNVFYLHALDNSANIDDGLSQEYWRALFDIGGRIVTLSVIGFADNPIGNSDGLATLESFVDRVRRENPATPVSNDT